MQSESFTTLAEKDGVNDEATQQRLRRLSWLLDNSIRLPTGHRIGIDGLIGLIPGLGDLFGAAMSSYFMLQASRLGVSKAVIGHMGVNIVFETIVGAIPVLGDLFDLAFKANARNYRLIEDYLQAPKKRKSASSVVVATTGLVMLIVFVLVAAVVFAVIRLAWQTLFGS